MDETEITPLVRSNEEPGVYELLGMFDVPAFARRGVELESALKRLHLRLERERAQLLEMVRLRLRQWATVATGPDDGSDLFKTSIAPLYQAVPLAEAPVWAASPAPARRRRAVARDLVASIVRFNHRWLLFLRPMRLDSVNRQIDQYNRYYVLEKECVIGSARLASRNFVPKAPQSVESILADHPLLPVPELTG